MTIGSDCCVRCATVLLLHYAYKCRACANVREFRDARKLFATSFISRPTTFQPVFSRPTKSSTCYVELAMPLSTPNANGSSQPQDTPYGPWDSFPWEAFPEYAGSKSLIYRSSDGTIVAGAAKESGKATLTYPCHEFFYVTDGWVKLAIHGGPTMRLAKGDFIFLHKGTTVDFEFGEGFANVACFIDRERVTLI